MEPLLLVALHPAYTKEKQKKHFSAKRASRHARLFGSARRSEIRRRRSAAEIDRQRNLRLHRVAVSPAPLEPSAQPKGLLRASREACAWGDRGLDIHALRRRDHWSMLPRDA